MLIAIPNRTIAGDIEKGNPYLVKEIDSTRTYSVAIFLKGGFFTYVSYSDVDLHNTELMSLDELAMFDMLYPEIGVKNEC